MLPMILLQLVTNLKEWFTKKNEYCENVISEISMLKLPRESNFYTLKMFIMNKKVFYF